MPIVHDSLGQATASACSGIVSIEFIWNKPIVIIATWVLLVHLQTMKPTNADINHVLLQEAQTFMCESCYAFGTRVLATVYRIVDRGWWWLVGWTSLNKRGQVVTRNRLLVPSYQNKFKEENSWIGLLYSGLYFWYVYSLQDSSSRLKCY